VFLALLAFGWGAPGQVPKGDPHRLSLHPAGVRTPAAPLPAWVGLACGMALGLGVVFGSRRTVQMVGQGFYRVQNLQGLCAESAAMLLVGASSIAGFPM